MIFLNLIFFYLFSISAQAEIVFGETEIIDPRSRLGVRRDSIDPDSSYEVFSQLGLSNYTRQKLRLNQAASVRGARSEHLGFYVNGLEMNDGSSVGGTGDLSVFLGISGEMSVSLLPQTVRLGENAFVGSVEVSSSPLNPRLDSAVGSDSSGELGLGFERDSLSGYIQASGSKGISSAQSLTSQAPERDGAHRVSAFSQVLSEKSRIFALISTAKSNEDAGPYDDDLSARSETQNLSAGASWKLKSDLQLSVSGKSLMRFFEDESDFSGDLLQSDHYKSEMIRAEIQKPYEKMQNGFLHWWLISASEQSANFSETSFSRADFDLAGEFKWSLNSEFWVESGARKTFSRGSQDRNQGRLRLGFDVVALDISLSERQPSFYQKYSQFGNSELKLERQTTIGVLAQLSDELSLLVYESQFSNLVSFDSALSKYTSFAKTQNHGFDLDWKKENTSLRVSYVEVRDQLTGLRLLQFPEWRVESSQKFAISEFQILSASLSGVSNSQQSGDFISASKSIDLKYTQVRGWGDWHLAVDNILNESRVFQRGYLEAGRVLRLGLSYNL